MLDQAFDALKTYDWGVDPKVIQAIDEAIVSSHGDEAVRKDLEARLIAVLASDAPRAAKDAVCRSLKTIGTAASVPALAAVLPDETLSHMGRYALERIPTPEAGQAMREALPKVSGKLKIGLISSLGVRGEAASIAPLQSLLADSDPAVTRSAAQALATLGSPEAHKALSTAKPNPATKAAIDDILLALADKQRAAGNKQDAKATYERILAGNPSKAAQFAATSGMQACSAN